MSGVPNVFGSATSSIPLSQLDVNFNTPVTIGNTTVGLGNTVTSFGNVTLTNTTISSATSVTSSVFYPSATSGTGIQMTSTGNNNGNWTIANNYGQMTVATEGAAGSFVTGSSQGAALFGNSSNAVAQIFTNNTVRATLDVSGNLGLGVTPSAWLSSFRALDIGTTGSLAYFSSGTYLYNNTYYNSGGTQVYKANGYAQYYTQNSLGAHVWGLAGNNVSGAGATATFTQAMTLDASGNLSNTGNFTSGTYIKAATYLWAAGTGAAGGVYLGAGSINGCISQTSQGFATTTTYIGNAQITTVSDSRLKENVVDTTIKAVDTLNKLRVVDHTWNDPSDQCENNRNSRGTWVGLIAQEAKPIIPWLVNKPTEDVDKDGNPQYWHMDYGYSVPLLIKAIQELSAQVTTLQTQVTALQTKVGV